MRLLVLITKITGALALLCATLGSIYVGISVGGQTKIVIFGAELATSNVGLALVCISLVVAHFTFRRVLTSLRDLVEEQQRPTRRRHKLSDHSGDTQV